MASTIAVVGLGHMGRSTLDILLDRLPGHSFIVVDRDLGAVDAAVERDPERISGCHTDVTSDHLDLVGVDIVINLTGPFFDGSDGVARAAITAGAAYVDIADDVEGTAAVLALDQAAVEAGVPLVTGAGLSPGVSNWMACRLLHEYPNADEVQVAWVVHESDPGGLAPLQHMLHMAVSPCWILRNGSWQESPGFVPATAASFQFPDPVGVVEAYDAAHPEPVTLARHFPHLRSVGCKGALQPDWANAAFSTLGRIGFGYSDVTVDIGGVEVQPAEFLWKLMWARHGRRPNGARSSHSAVLVQALADREVLSELVIQDQEAMTRGTGLGAAVAALLLLKHGAEPGAWGPETLPWDVALPLFEELATERGGFVGGVAPTPRGSRR